MLLLTPGVLACGQSGGSPGEGTPAAGGMSASAGSPMTGGTSTAGMHAAGTAGTAGTSAASGGTSGASSQNGGRPAGGGSASGGKGGMQSSGGSAGTGGDAAGSAGAPMGGDSGESAGGSGGTQEQCEMTLGEPDASGSPSCRGISSTCGPTEDESCCNTRAVAGGTFNRVADSRYPATVSDFHLDRYEVTLGRFKNFAACYPGNRPTAGSGKNPNDPNDTGWDSAWDAELPADRAALEASLACESTRQTWGKAESRLPMNCVSWYVAFAFCVWDGGRLPTDAEWQYAASGGAEQRYYPWSDPATDMTIDDAHLVKTGSLLPVGSKSPAGDGLYGQADLAGSVGEWLLDYAYTSLVYPVPCDDCANHEAPSNGAREHIGGAVGDSLSHFTTTSAAGDTVPEGELASVGLRCARL